MTRSRPVSLSALLTLTLSCQTPAQQALTDAQRAALADTVKQQAAAFTAAFNKLDPSVFIDQLAVNERYAENASIYPSRDSLTSALRAFVSSSSRFDAAWDDVHVTVLSPDAAVLTGTFHETVADKAGTEMNYRGVWTGVYQRRDAKWGIVQAHESYAVVK